MECIVVFTCCPNVFGNDCMVTQQGQKPEEMLIFLILFQNDRFEGIISDLSKKQDVPVEVISLSFTDSKGNLQTLQAFDTPTSVKLSRTDIIGKDFRMMI